MRQHLKKIIHMSFVLQKNCNAAPDHKVQKELQTLFFEGILTVVSRHVILRVENGDILKECDQLNVAFLLGVHQPFVLLYGK